MEWLQKNLKYITILFVFLFLFKSFQSCNRNMTINTIEKKNTVVLDSVSKEFKADLFLLNTEVDSLKKEVLVRDYMIINLEKDLEIAGVKTTAAERRADAVQRTAERVKSNTTTTIQIKGAEKDTTNIK